VAEIFDSLHVNQAYDKYVAMHDKIAKKEILGFFRNQSFYNKGMLDQWGMVHVCLFVIRYLKLEAWTNSFCACNLDPPYKVLFPDW
jgi:hypothetical protein